jgi:hypothetical protein
MGQQSLANCVGLARPQTHALLCWPHCCCCCCHLLLLLLMMMMLLLLLLLLLQLMHEVWPEGLYEPLQQVIDIARLAASLQPDGTGMPEVRWLVVCHCAVYVVLGTGEPVCPLLAYSVVGVVAGVPITVFALHAVDIA